MTDEESLEIAQREIRRLHQVIREMRENLATNSREYWVQQIAYNPASDRLELGGTPLHCGDILEVLLLDGDNDPVWTETRLEYEDMWYLVGHENIQPCGLFARMRHC